MTDTYDHYYSRRRRRQSSFFVKFLKLLFFFIGVTTVFTLIFFWINNLNTLPRESRKTEIISPIGKPLPTIISSELNKVVKESLAGTSGTYAVAVKNLKTGEEYYQNEHLVFEAASLYKLWIMLTTYQQMKDGKLTEDTDMRAKIEELNERFDIATESAELQEGEVGMSVGTALERMITISHNYAALLLSARIRLANVNSDLIKYNLDESKLNPPKTTASDIAKYYELLYDGKLIDREYSEKMRSLLLRQQLNDRIPKYLPEEVEIAHKTGELDGFKHDAGIVYTESGDYIIVLLSRSTNPQAAAERLALLSQDIYVYFQNKAL